MSRLPEPAILPGKIRKNLNSRNKRYSPINSNSERSRKEKEEKQTRAPRRRMTYALATAIRHLLAAASFIASLSFSQATDRNFNLTEGQLLLLILPTPILSGILSISLGEMLPKPGTGIRP